MFTIAALYHFTRFDDPEALQGPLYDLCHKERISGTLILAREGINGTIAGPDTGIRAVICALQALPGCATLKWKESHAEDHPFRRLKVRV